MKKVIFILFLIVIVAVSQVFAVEIETDRSGNWNSPLTWSGGVVPGLEEDVLIKEGVVVYVDPTATCQANVISLNSGARLKFRPAGEIQSRLFVNEGINFGFGAKIEMRPGETIQSYDESNPSASNGVWSSPNGAYYSNDLSSATSTLNLSSHTFFGYGYNFPSVYGITGVWLNVDAWCAVDDGLKVSVSTTSASNWLSSVWSVASLSQSKQNYYIDISTWANWTPDKLNANVLRIKVEHLLTNTTDLVYLDWVGTKVGSLSTGKNVSLTAGGDLALAGGNSMIDVDCLTDGTTISVSVKNIKLIGELSKVDIDVPLNGYDAELDFDLTQDLTLNEDAGAKFYVTVATRAVVSVNARNTTVGDTGWLNINVTGDDAQVSLNNLYGVGENAGIFTVNGWFFTTITGENSIVEQNVNTKMKVQPLAWTEWDCSSVYTSSIVVNLYSWQIYENKPASIDVEDIKFGMTAKNAAVKFLGANPAIGTQKPDSDAVPRNCRINSTIYIAEVSGCRPYEMFRAEHIGFNGDVVLTGIGGKGDAECSGSPGARVVIYNCDFEGFWDSLSLLGCSRINQHWYGQGISSSIARGAENAGILFVETEKSFIYNCDIYDNVGGNIGYGILLKSSDENEILKNRIYSNKIRGIYFEDSDKNLIDTNRVFDQTAEEGISLVRSNKNVIIENECYNNRVHGIAFESDSQYNYIAANKCYSNKVSGMRVRFGSDGNIFVMNTSSGNAGDVGYEHGTAFTSHESVGTLCVAEIYRDNKYGDIYVEGEVNLGYISQIWLKDCLLGSTTEFTNTPFKQEFTKENSWVISQKHDNSSGITKIWGQFSMPQSAHTWHTSDMLKWNCSEQLYEGKVHGWNTVVTAYDTPMLRYDDGGVDGEGGDDDITSITTSSTTESELWLVSYGYGIDEDKWQVRGTRSGIQNNLLTHDEDYTSDNGEVRIRLTHRYSPISVGEQYVFVAIAGSKDENIQKEIDFCDFSDPEYIGASFLNNTGGTVEFIGTVSSPTIITRELAMDAPNATFYYGVSLGGTINEIEYATFTYLNKNGLNFTAAPLVNTEYLSIWNLEPGGTYISADGVTHIFDEIVIETGTVNVAGYWNVIATNSVLTFRDYTRPGLPDYLNNSTVYWDPTLEWSGLSGFVADGVEPNDAPRMTKREFQIKYIDRGLATNGNPPTTVQVWIDFDDDGIFVSSEKFGLEKKSGEGEDYTSGVRYNFSVEVDYAGDGILHYRFYSGNPLSVTVSTITYFSSYTATGEGVLGSTLTVQGTVPRVTVVPLVGEQWGQVAIDYYLIDDDNKQLPHNLCDIVVEYDAGSGWQSATEGVGGDGTEDLIASTGTGTLHTYVWNSDTDLEEKELSNVRIRIIPSDEDGTGSPTESTAFYLDNIRVSKLAFATSPQDIPFGTTSQIITILAQSPTGYTDIDAGLTLDLVTTSADYAFLKATEDIVITSVTMQLGEARFRYVDNIIGNSLLTVSEIPDVGIANTAQTWIINSGGTSSLTSSVTVTGATYVAGSTVTVEVTLRDYYSDPVSNKNVNISVTGTGNIITQPSGLTQPDGKAYGYLSSTKAEEKVITASDITEDIVFLKSSATITIIPAAVDADISTFTVTPVGNLTIGATVAISITLMDVYLNPVEGKSINISINPTKAGDVVNYPTPTTDANGEATATFSPGADGVRTIVMIDTTDGITLTSSYTVTVLYDGEAPTVDSTVPGSSATVTSPVSYVSATLQDDVGGSGVNLTSSTIRLMGPGPAEVLGTTFRSGNTLTLTFPSEISTNGDYEIKIVTVDNANNISASTYTVTFTLNIIGPVQESAFKESVYAYPNPAKSQAATFHCNLPFSGDVTIKVYNIMGELVYEETQAGQPIGENTYPWSAVNTSNIPVGTGVYIFELTLDNGSTKYVERKKVIIIK
jgi:parallel beta-helix repeat protein